MIETQPTDPTLDLIPQLEPHHAAVFRALGARLESLGQSLGQYAGRQTLEQTQLRALLDALDPNGNGAHSWDWGQIFDNPVQSCKSNGQQAMNQYKLVSPLVIQATKCF